MKVKVGNHKMKRKMLLLLVFIAAFALYSCEKRDTYASVMIDFVPPENAALTVRDIRVKGFTLDWTVAEGSGYEYAIAASHNGNITDYETALKNNKVVLDFTASEFLNGTYKATNLIPGKEYKIKVFIRAGNVKATEYLNAEASLPYAENNEIYNVRINGKDTEFDKTTDTFSYSYLLGTEDNVQNYMLTYKLLSGYSLYIDGIKNESATIELTPYYPLEITVVHEKTQTARDYSIYTGGISNGIPIVIVDTENNRRIRDKENNVTAHMKIIDDGYNPLGVGLYDGAIEIRGRGNSSWGMPKQGYNFEMTDKVQLLDMAPSREWLFMANYSDKSLMRNYTAFEFSRDMGMAFAPKMRFVDFILNGEYLGTYCIGERVKVDEGRLDFPKIKAGMTDEYELTGTYVLEINNRSRLTSTKNTFTSTKISGNQYTVWGIAEGDIVVIRQPGDKNLSTAAFNYIKNYFNDAEDALFSDYFKDPEFGYRAYMDSASFVDWYLINEFFKQVDGDVRLSTFLYKPRGDKLYMGPVWDFDLGAGNADYRSCDDPEGWYIRTSIWFERLFEDEAFEKEFKDRWNYLKKNGYFDRLFKRIDDTASLIDKSAQMNFQKWDILGRYVWPNAGSFWERTTYQSEVDYLKEWLMLRFNWMDKEINK